MLSITVKISRIRFSHLLLNMKVLKVFYMLSKHSNMAQKDHINEFVVNILKKDSTYLSWLALVHYLTFCMVTQKAHGNFAKFIPWLLATTEPVLIITKCCTTYTGMQPITLLRFLFLLFSSCTTQYLLVVVGLTMKCQPDFRASWSSSRWSKYKHTSCCVTLLTRLHCTVTVGQP